jgi:hypothetical protein
MPGSTEPDLVPIMRPSSGVKPIVVSILCPFVITAKGTAISQMTRNELQTIWTSSEQLRCPSRAVLMIDPVKAVPANSFLQPAIRPGIRGRRRRHVMMESSIENSDLRHGPKKLADDSHTSSSARLWSGAKTETFSIAVMTSEVTNTGLL